VFPYALLPHYDGAKRNTIRVTKGTNVKMLHHKGHVPAYRMEDETPFIHHAIEC
jgi:hypothetical protein